MSPGIHAARTLRAIVAENSDFRRSGRRRLLRRNARLRASGKWRRSQLDAGMIEVAVEGIEPTTESEGPPGALKPEEMREAYNEYRWLAGWED